jgi:uncharacterized membrane protein HdeD (DUF308 family)
MTRSAINRKWWVLLIQGIILIVLSIIIFNNPDALLTALAFWLGLIVIATGLIGIISWFANTKEKRDTFSIIGSSTVLIIGIIMVTNTGITMKAITLLFSLLVAAVGVILISGSWNERKKWSLWWIIASIGAIALILGIKSIVDVYSGAQSISIIIGISVLLSGIGLVILSFLKKKIAVVVDNRKYR